MDSEFIDGLDSHAGHGPVRDAMLRNIRCGGAAGDNAASVGGHENGSDVANRPKGSTRFQKPARAVGMFPGAVVAHQEGDIDQTGVRSIRRAGCSRGWVAGTVQDLRYSGGDGRCFAITHLPQDSAHVQVPMIDDARLYRKPVAESNGRAVALILGVDLGGVVVGKRSIRSRAKAKIRAGNTESETAFGWGRRRRR